MADNFAQNNRFTTKVSPAPETLGVARELRRFAMNEYLDSRNKKVLIGTSDTVADDDAPVDDLLLTNAVTENTVQDEIDKTRYLKEAKAYVTISSAARNTTATETGGGTNSLFTTGTEYYLIFPFAPYSLITDGNGDPLEIDGNYFVLMNSNINHIQFQLQDWTIETAPVQVLTPQFSEIFDVFLPAGGVKLTLDQLQASLETNLNLAASTGKPLDNSTDKYHMFGVTVIRYPTINPDRASVIISCQDNFRFTMTFFSFGNIESAPIAKPVAASDAAYVVQDPAAVYPFPNSYALDLNKAYTVVKAVRVVKSEFPNTDTIINVYNNHVTFRLIDKTKPPPTETDPYSQNITTKSGSLDWDVYLPYGNYDLPQLVSQMELVVNNMLFGEAGLSNVFTIQGNQVTNVFEISVHDPYAFKWNFNANADLKWRNLYDMLGYRDSFTSLYVTKFSNVINTNMGAYTLHNPYKPIVLRKSNVIWLQLNNYETIYDSLTKINYFCKFTLDNVDNGQFAYDTYVPSVHVFVDSPIPVLQKVDVRLYDELGLPYNFNGVDHSFTLELTYHIDRLMGVDIASRRGINDKSSYI